VGLGCTIELVQTHHLGDIVATNRRHVRDGPGLQAAAMATLVHCHFRHVNLVDRRLLLSDGLDDCCCGYVGFCLFGLPMYFSDYFIDCYRHRPLLRQEAAKQ